MERIKLGDEANTTLRKQIMSLTKRAGDTSESSPLTRTQAELLMNFLDIATESGIQAAFNTYPAHLIGFTFENGELSLNPNQVASGFDISAAVVKGMLAPKMNTTTGFES